MRGTVDLNLNRAADPREAFDTARRQGRFVCEDGRWFYVDGEIDPA